MSLHPHFRGPVCLAAAFGLAVVCQGQFQADLTISQLLGAHDWVYDTTWVCADVTNIGTLAAGPFNVGLGVAKTGTTLSTTVSVAGLAVGGTAYLSYCFTGSDWKTVWADADSSSLVPESNEGNNSRSDKVLCYVAYPGTSRIAGLTVVNPSLDEETVTLYVVPPTGWSVAVSPDTLTLAPQEQADVQVEFTPPMSFEGHQEIAVTGEFADGTPGVMEWEFHFFSAPVATDRVVCEPQGGQNPAHPPTYWYDVTPTASGRCNFHVRVFDPHPNNYTNPSLPTPNWQFAVHQVADQWWASWWSPGCTEPILVAFRFQFDNADPSVAGEWTTTIDGSSDPYAQVVDVSCAHSDDPDGQGALVHVPIWLGPPAIPGYGDLNCDGHVDFDDINPFVTALVGRAGYEAQYPQCRWLNGDIDGNGYVDFGDINPFVKCLVNGGCP